MPSVIDICNRALSHTGTDQAIASLDEKSKEARICARWYEASRDQLLRAFAWNFAQRRVTLADMGEPPTGWDFRYRYPTDCLDLQVVYQAGSHRPASDTYGTSLAPYTVASSGDGGRVILTNLADAEATYTAQLSDPNLFPPDFAATLELTLAANIAMPMTANPKLADYLAQKAERALNDAMASNLNEAQLTYQPDADWVLDRTGGV